MGHQPHMHSAWPLPGAGAIGGNLRVRSQQRMPPAEQARLVAAFAAAVDACSVYHAFVRATE